MTDIITLEPGSHSHGTLRDEDMRDMFDSIAVVTECEWCREEVKALNVLFVEVEQCVLNAQAGVSESIHYLFDHVEEHHTPDGYYFGSVEGDGADFGVWESEET